MESQKPTKKTKCTGFVRNVSNVHKETVSKLLPGLGKKLKKGTYIRILNKGEDSDTFDIEIKSWKSECIRDVRYEIYSATNPVKKTSKMQTQETLHNKISSTKMKLGNPNLYSVFENEDSD